MYTLHSVQLYGIAQFEHTLSTTVLAAAAAGDTIHKRNKHFTFKKRFTYQILKTSNNGGRDKNA